MAASAAGDRPLDFLIFREHAPYAIRRRPAFTLWRTGRRRDRDRIAMAALREALLRWTMPKRFRPTGTSGLKPGSTWQVGSLVLARPRPSVGYSTLKSSERL